MAKTLLQYSTDGQSWNNIRTLNGNPGQINWTVPEVTEIKSTCLIRVVFKDASGSNIVITESDAVFTIALPQPN